jgi:C1A family cysteine protease
MGARNRGTYPGSYDLRSLGKLTPVENQNPYGACWAFAALASLESCLLPSDLEDFSQDNLARNTGFDADPYNGGGNASMATAYLARWGGPVASAEDAYGDSYTPPGLIAEKHAQEVLFLPPRSGPTDTSTIKWALMTYGAVYTTLYADDSLGKAGSSTWSPAHAAYYYAGSTNINHAVDIVGWNDGYSRYNFATTAPGDGAFIVRNSWGASFGEGGYFYVSYYDSLIANESLAVFDSAEATGNYSAIYQYDPLGWTDSLGYLGNTGWFANRFSASSNGQLAAVSFYAACPNSSYTLYCSTGSSAMTQDGSGTVSMAGYHTVSLPVPVTLTAGQLFTVAVRLTTPGYDYPVPLETNIAGYSGKAASTAGQSFVSPDGSSWSDLTSLSGGAGANVCLKAFTRTAGSSDLTPPTTSVTGAGGWHNSVVSLGFPASDAGLGVAFTQFQLDGRGWLSGAATTISAPTDHTNDGLHSVLYRSVDLAGNVESPHSCGVGIDTIAPTTTIVPAQQYMLDYWNNVASRLTFKTADGAGSGAVLTELNLDNAGWIAWAAGTSYVIGAPTNHSNDGDHVLQVRSTDAAGNQEAAQQHYVSIDTRRPSVRAPRASVVRRGSYATLRFAASDPSPSDGSFCVVIKVKTLSGRLKQTIAPRPWYRCGSMRSCRYLCRLPRGKYRFWVTAYDAALNPSTRAVSNYLTVR